MKRDILFILIGIILIVTISAGTVKTIMTIKPSTPSTTVAFVSNPNSVSESILLYTKRGFIVKTVTNSTLKGNIIVVMEKY